MNICCSSSVSWSINERCTPKDRSCTKLSFPLCRLWKGRGTTLRWFCFRLHRGENRYHRDERPASPDVQEHFQIYSAIPDIQEHFQMYSAIENRTWMKNLGTQDTLMSFNVGTAASSPNWLMKNPRKVTTSTSRTACLHPRVNAGGRWQRGLLARVEDTGT